jgi:hypothetical protein
MPLNKFSTKELKMAVRRRKSMTKPTVSDYEDLSDFGTLISEEQSFVFGEIIDDQPIVESILTDSSTDPKLGFANGQLVRNS